MLQRITVLQRKRRQQIIAKGSKSRGFALTSLLFFLPVLIIFCGGSLALLATVTVHRDRQHLCRKTLLKVQSPLARAMTKLLRLNPKALRLQLERTRIELKIAMAAAKPVLLPPLMAQRQLIIARQRALHLLQQQIIREGIALAHLEATPLTTRHGFSSVATQIKLAVVARPPTSDSPQYFPKEPFVEEQNIGSHWRLNMKDVLPEDLFLLGINLPDLQGKCAVSIFNEGGGAWKPGLYRAKS